MINFLYRRIRVQKHENTNTLSHKLAFSLLNVPTLYMQQQHFSPVAFGNYCRMLHK